jgi:subtilisin family serine protease
MNVGVDRTGVFLTLVKVNSNRDMVRLARTLLRTQAANNDAATVISMSISWGMNPRFQGVPKRDFGPYFLARMPSANVAVVVAAGNSALEPDNTVNNTLRADSPQVHGGPNSPMILVGAADEDGNRAIFSEYRDGGTGKVSLYTIGTNIMVPFPLSKNSGRGSDVSYLFRAGTSYATPLTAGILTNLMGRDNTVTALNAKARLIAIATQRKGINWPIDLPGAPIVPRMATDLEVACIDPNPGPQPDPLYTATWYDWQGGVTRQYRWSMTALPIFDKIEDWYTYASETATQVCTARPQLLLYCSLGQAFKGPVGFSQTQTDTH